MDVTTIQNNECFLFFPFSLKTKKCQYDFFPDYLTNNKNWYRENIDSGIFYEYISRRFGTGEHIKKCNVFSLNKDNDFITAYSKDIYSITEPIRFGKEVYKVYNFKIKGIKFITFDDAVFFLVFQINFLTKKESINTKILANTLYFLKKTTKTKIEQQSNKKQLTLSEFAYEIIEFELKNISKKIKAKMFFHIAEENARANFFLMANISINIEDEDCVNELYFLKNAFCDEYRNIHHRISMDDAYFAPNGRVWGISPEASVCLTRFNHAEAEKKMFKEFESSYFMMYVFLLYQKYRYYYFLTEIKESKVMKTRDIKKYNDELIDFEIDNVFSVITEIPQYMQVYKEHIKKHNLGDLQQDVRDPLNKLRDIRTVKNEHRIALLGIVLSVFGLVSVLIDIYLLFFNR